MKISSSEVRNIIANQMTNDYTSHAAVEVPATEDPTTEAKQKPKKPKKAKEVAITEADFLEHTKDFESATDLEAKFASAVWDGSSLEEDKVYHLNQVGGLRIFSIKANRRTHRRALKMLNACTTSGMTTPAILVDAKLVSDWELKLADPLTMEDVSADAVEGAYCLMEGHGRFHAHLLDLALAIKDGHAAFDFNFVYKKYDSPEAFGQAFVSTNLDMTRTTNKDRLEIAGDRCQNPLVKSFIMKNKEDHVLPKAGYFWTYGRELTKDEVSNLTYDSEDAPKFNEELTTALESVYSAFKVCFSVGGEKIYRGVAAAMWAAKRLKEVDDKLQEADSICEHLQHIHKDIYSTILTASSNSKKHLRREDVIVAALEKMME